MATITVKKLVWDPVLGVWVDADAAPGPSLLESGGNPQFRYEVTSDASLSNIALLDDNGTAATADDFTPTFQEGDVNFDGVLDPGETWLYTATGTWQSGLQTNVATVTGTADGYGGPVEDSDPASYNGVAVEKFISVISLDTGGTIGSNSMLFDDGDLIAIDLPTQSASLYQDEMATFGSDNNIDGLHLLPHGVVIFSVESSALQLAPGPGIALDPGEEDLFVLVPDATTGAPTFFKFQDVTDASVMGFAGYDMPFENASQIDAVHFLADGRVILSTEGANTIAGLSYEKSDLVLYDPGTGTASLLFDFDAAFAEFGYESGQDPSIDALHVTRFHETGGTLMLDEIIISVTNDLKDGSGNPVFKNHHLFQITFDAGGNIWSLDANPATPELDPVFDTTGGVPESTETPINAYSQAAVDWDVFLPS